MIREKTAKRIARLWHGGQTTAYYQFTCTGYLEVNHHRYLKETEDNIRVDLWPCPGVLKASELKELQALKEYFVNMGKKIGMDTKTKLIEFAFPLSELAKRAGFKESGCWFVILYPTVDATLTKEKPLAYFLNKQDAYDYANELPYEWNHMVKYDKSVV